MIRVERVLGVPRTAILIFILVLRVILGVVVDLFRFDDGDE